MAELVDFDPGFVALLREVAASPRSRILRVPQGREVPLWFGGEAGFESRMELAERELLRVGRNELGWLFRQAALRELIDGERTRDEVMFDRPTDARQRPLEREAIARGWADRRGPVEVEPSAIALLDRWLSASAPQRPSVAALAAASMRFSPAAQARALAGADYVLRGATATAEEYLLASLSLDSTSAQAFPTWINLAVVCLRQGRPDRALAATRIAASITPTSFVAWANVVLCATIAGDQTLLRSAARELETLVSEDVGDAYRAVLRHQRRRRLLVVQPSASAFAKRHEGDFGIAGRILHELI